MSEDYIAQAMRGIELQKSELAENFQQKQQNQIIAWVFEFMANGLRAHGIPVPPITPPLIKAVRKTSALIYRSVKQRFGRN